MEKKKRGGSSRKEEETRELFISRAYQQEAIWPLKKKTVTPCASFLCSPVPPWCYRACVTTSIPAPGVAAKKDGTENTKQSGPRLSAWHAVTARSVRARGPANVENRECTR